MKKALIFAAILLVIIGFPLAKKYFISNKLADVEVTQVAKHIIKASILASGQLKHEQEVKLSSEVIGKISRLYVREGEHVVKGQLLLEIDDQAYVAAVQQQQAAVEQQLVTIEKQKLIVANLLAQWQRKSMLFKQKLLDSDSFDSITNQYEVAEIDLKAANEALKQVEARLDQAKDQLSKTKIKSPIDGMVTSLDIKEGETAISSSTNIAGSSLMTIADPASMMAEINVDEADIASVALGQKAEIIAIAFADKPIYAKVESIASSAKQALGRQSLSFAVKLQLDPATNINLRPGMSCRAEVFTRGEQELLAVPLRAVQTTEDNDKDLVESYVYVIEQGVVHKIKISTGISDDSFQEVLGGLQQGTVVAIGPDKVIRHLKDGDKVNSVDSDKITSTTPMNAI